MRGAGPARLAGADPIAAAQRLERPDPGVVEHQATDTVSAPIGDPGRDRGQPRRHGAFERAHRSEIHTHALIDDDHRRTVPFLGVRAHKRLAVAQRCTQVQTAQVIPSHVAAKLGEIQPPAP
ncbi:hypothetical protein G6F22_013441 [Rhizopus arrhizus]|nr:hypothetical protein G6F22_013441 [Rhizopus arrhizus]